VGFISLFVLFMVWMIFRSELSATLIFDKQTGKLLWRRRTHRGREPQTYLLRRIRDIQIATERDSNNKTSYILKLLPDSIYRHSLMSSQNRYEVEQIEKTIRDFLWRG